MTIDEFLSGLVAWWEASMLEKLYDYFIKLIQRDQAPHDAKRYLDYLHSPTTQDIFARLLVKHPSEWFYAYDEAIWQSTDKEIIKRDPVFASGKKTQIEQLIWMKEVPAFNTEKNIWHMHPIVFLDQLRANHHDIIFPLLTKPQNDIEGRLNGYYWAIENLNDKGANQAIFDWRRSEGRRRHAGRDLYSEKNQDVVAIADGVVLRKTYFYSQTDEVTVFHTTKSGRQFLVRYGELDSPSIKVKVGDKVSQGQVLGCTGLLLEADGTHTKVVPGEIIYMLHFELYTGERGYNIKEPLTHRGHVNQTQDAKYKGKRFERRDDLKDPLELLVEGYNNTFGDIKEKYIGDRRDPSSLHLSAKGEAFIKSWESLETVPYNDSEGFCTIGWGHLIEHKSCSDPNIKIPEEFTAKDEFGNKKFNRDAADKLFIKDLEWAENAVRALGVRLYQHEFDALTSLCYNMGPGGFGKKTPKLVGALKAGDYTNAAPEFLDITNQGNAGLKRRREYEHDIFLYNKYENN